MRDFVVAQRVDVNAGWYQYPVLIHAGVSTFVARRADQVVKNEAISRERGPRDRFAAFAMTTRVLPDYCLTRFAATIS